MKALLVAIVCLPLAAAADDPPVIKDAYAFDWSRPTSSKCTKVTGALLDKLAHDYVCKKLVDRGSASGKPLVAVCTAKKGNSEYFVLATAKDCNEERDTQLANGD